ncbi:hypothetical protein OQA88_8414 [Cercophora sp. LCS_1]
MAHQSAAAGAGCDAVPIPISWNLVGPPDPADDRLIGTCNSYPWGKKGPDSLASQLCAKTDKGFSVNDDEYYSEMWFGDYEDFPGRVYNTGEPLEILEKNKGTLLGGKVIEKLDGQLPYLPKVEFIRHGINHSIADQLDEAAYILDLTPRLQDQYGAGDPGLTVALTCMNFIVLEAGDAIYVPADGIHAHLSSDIVECMACSNNALNSGFCPPADRKNIDMFCGTLTFKGHSQADVILRSRKSEKSATGKTVVYKPPMSEFDLLKTALKVGENDKTSASDGPGVFIVTHGKGKMQADSKMFELDEGFIYFIALGVEIKWETDTAMEIHMAVV